MPTSDIEIFKVLAVLEIIVLTAIILRKKWGLYGWVLIVGIHVILGLYKGNYVVAILPVAFNYILYRYFILPEWKNFR